MVLRNASSVVKEWIRKVYGPEKKRWLENTTEEAVWCFVKIQRFRWAARVERTIENRVPNWVTKGQLAGRRGKERSWTR